MNTIQNRIFGLDFLRALAIFLVLLSHVHYIIDQTNPTFLALSGLMGYFGVEIFFILSGFLIGTILLKEYLQNQFSIHFIFKFLKRRWLRTLPNYYLILILNIAIALYFNYEQINVLPYFFFLQNFNNYSITFFAESWSLSIEEWAYILFPVSLFCFQKIKFLNRKFKFIYLIIFWILIFHFIRLFNTNFENITQIDQWNTKIKSVVIFRIDAILWGFLLAWGFHFYKQILQKYKIYFIIVAVHLFILQFFILSFLGVDVDTNPVYFKVFYFTLTAIIILLAFPVFIFFNNINYFLYKPIKWLSLTSYSAYLLHYSVISVFLKNNVFKEYNFTNSLKIGLYFGFTFLFSSLLYYYFEKPILKYRDKN